MNRLLVLLQIIAIPVYFTIFNIVWYDDIQAFFDSDNFILNLLPNWLVWFEVNLAIPIFFSLPWVIITLLRASRIADAYTLMGRALGKVRIDQKLFYGINAAFLLIFLILPFGSPLFTIIAVIVAVRMVMRKLVIGRLSKIFWIIPAIILAAIPTLVTIAFFINYNVIFDKVLDIWTENIDDIFYVGLCLAIAITIANFFSVLIERGIRNNRSKADPYRLIYLITFTLFLLFVLIYFANDANVVYINALNLVAGILGVIGYLIRRASDLPLDAAGANVMVFLFIIINILTRWIKEIVPTDIFRAFLIVVSGLVFFALFLLSYKYATDEELIDRHATG